MSMTRGVGSRGEDVVAGAIVPQKKHATVGVRTCDLSEPSRIRTYRYHPNNVFSQDKQNALKPFQSPYIGIKPMIALALSNRLRASSAPSSTGDTPALYKRRPGVIVTQVRRRSPLAPSRG